MNLENKELTWRNETAHKLYAITIFCKLLPTINIGTEH